MKLILTCIYSQLLSFNKNGFGMKADMPLNKESKPEIYKNENKKDIKSSEDDLIYSLNHLPLNISLFKPLSGHDFFYQIVVEKL